MYTIPLVVKDDYFQAMLDQALELDINRWLPDSGCVIGVYAREELKGERASSIRAATDVERLHVEIDVVLELSYLECAPYTQEDMLVLISHELSKIELTYSGGDDAPAIFIREQKFSVAPNVLKYFGAGNKVYRDVIEAISTSDSGSYHGRYEERQEPGMYSALKEEAPPNVRQERNSIYNLKE